MQASLAGKVPLPSFRIATRHGNNFNILRRRFEALPKVSRLEVTACPGAASYPSMGQYKVKESISLPGWPTKSKVDKERLSALQAEKEALELKYSALSKQCSELKSELELWKVEAANYWNEYAGARKRILAFMEEIESLNHNLQVEKKARCQAEFWLGVSSGKGSSQP